MAVPLHRPGDIIEVDGHRHVHTYTSQYVFDRLGAERLAHIGEVRYDFWGNNIAEKYNLFCARDYSDWFIENMHIPWITVILYMLFIYFGKQYMSSRPKFQIKTQLMWWNLGLSIFSAGGVFYTVPHVLGMLYYGGLEYTICSPAEGKFAHGNVALWGTLFVLSKFPELFDTAFIVLRKSKLIFLHWYHHVTVLLCCWHGFGTRSASALIFTALNYSVHMVMYYYYFQAARGHRPPWAKFVTAIQISQMFIGCFVCMLTYYYWNQGKVCDVDVQNWGYASLMYLSYLILFIWFALQRYVFKKPIKRKKTKKDRENQV